MGLHDLSIDQYIEYYARVDGGKPAVIDASGEVSYLELHQKIEQLAAGIRARAIEKGHRVCILAHNSIEFFVTLGACARTGAIAVPISWRLSPEEVMNVIDLAEPQMLVVDAAQLPKIRDLDLGKIGTLSLIGGGNGKGFLPFSKLYAAPTQKHAAVHPDDAFVILATAAVEGLPRGATLTHHNLIMAGYALITALGLTNQDRHLAALPLFHITGLELSLAMLQTGAVNVVAGGFDPDQAAHWIDRFKVTLLASFPPVLSMLLEARQAGDFHWDSLRYVLGLDAPEVIQKLLKETRADFWTGYGQSETTGVVTLGSVQEKPGSAGKPLPLMRVRCVDDADAEAPVGTQGEIVVQGPLVFSGYWRDEDATDYTFRGGWHHTGDLGSFDQEGYLYYVGRKPEKELIKSGGENIYPAEVEHAIRELPQVQEVCVFGVPDEKWGETVKAVIEPVSGESLSVEQVEQAVVERIAAYKKPRHVEFVEQLPRNPDGEIDREATKKKFA